MDALKDRSSLRPAALRAALLAAGMLLSTAAFAADAPADVAQALKALRRATVVDAADDGLPTFLRGDLGQAPRLDPADLAATQRAMRPVLAPALAALRLQAGDLRLRRINVDAQGNQHLRYDQTHLGLDVVGGDLLVHVDGKGRVFALNGSARGDLPAHLGVPDVGEAAVHPRLMAEPRYAGMSTTPPRKVYLMLPGGAVHLAYETEVSGLRGREPVRDKVYIDLQTGAVLAANPQIHFALERIVTGAQAGPPLRTEGQAAVADADANAAYDNFGTVYAAFKAFFNRDSWNNRGAPLRIRVHDGLLCNSYASAGPWPFVFGNGDPSRGCLSPIHALDIVAHEFGHGVTDSESQLYPSGESGGIREAFSDIFGAFVEAWVAGGKTGALRVSANTWTFGESVSRQPLRYMNNPSRDGRSLDFWDSAVKTVDVHRSAGIGNLAFYLLSQGGQHPRGKSSVQVAGIGMDKAIRIFYEANDNVMGWGSGTYLGTAKATVQAAVNLGYSLADQISVARAWQAVGVAVATPGDPGPDVSGLNHVLGNALTVKVNGKEDFYQQMSLVVPAGQSKLTFSISGGTGDADLYTRFGQRPTLGAFDCRPFLHGNNETCSVNAPAAGTYYLRINGRHDFRDLLVTATYTGADGVPAMTGGRAYPWLTGAAGSVQYWKINAPAGKTLTVTTAGGSGDADLYVALGSRPTSTAYLCKSAGSGNSHSCRLTPTKAGEYHILVSGTSTFSGLTLSATY